jgi:SAM-dependent methyltransferase
MIKRLLEHSSVYSLWQRPFALRKFEPILRHNRMDAVRRVLDVGCGPGTNTPFFEHADYLGIDWNPRYVEAARRRHRRQFITADVTEYRVEAGERFDFILLNSLLHHIDTDGTERLLRHLSDLLADDGHIHILDLVLPEGDGISRRLAEWDRGDYPRPLDSWRELFEAAFKPVVFEPYGLRTGGIVLWNMVYFKGRKSA